jgi:hypothetical protein
MDLEVTHHLDTVIRIAFEQERGLNGLHSEIPDAAHGDASDLIEELVDRLDLRPCRAIGRCPRKHLDARPLKLGRAAADSMRGGDAAILIEGTGSVRRFRELADEEVSAEGAYALSLKIISYFIEEHNFVLVISSKVIYLLDMHMKKKSDGPIDLRSYMQSVKSFPESDLHHAGFIDASITIKGLWDVAALEESAPCPHCGQIIVIRIIEQHRLAPS